MAVYEVPLTPQAQTFSITLLGIIYKLTLSWCSPAAAWTLLIADQDGTALVGGVPLVTGLDLLAQYRYLGIGGSLVVATDGDITAVPTYENLGVDSHLYFVTQD